MSATRGTAIIVLVAMLFTYWLAQQKEKWPPVETAEPPLAATSDFAASTAQALADVENGLPPADKALFGRLKRPMGAFIENKLTEQLEAEAKAIEAAANAEAGADSGKKSVILMTIIGAAIIAAIKVLIKLWLMKLVIAYLWAHIWYVVGFGAAYVLVTWVIADMAARRAAYSVLAKAKVGK